MGFLFFGKVWKSGSAVYVDAKCPRICERHGQMEGGWIVERESGSRHTPTYTHIHTHTQA